MSENQGGYNINRNDEKLKKSFAEEKLKLSKMSFGEKLEYIFAYYKFAIAMIILVIAVIIYLIYHFNTYESYMLYGVVLNSYQVSEDAAQEIEDYVGMEKHEAVSLQAGIDSEASVDTGTIYNQIDLFTVAGEMDFVFTDETGAEKICEEGTCLKIEDVLPEDLYSLWEDRVVTLSVFDLNTEDTFVDAPVAVDISGTKVQKYFGLTDDTCYLLITDLSGNQQYMDSFYKMLYDIETGAIE